jgi:hypothetical protein
MITATRFTPKLARCGRKTKTSFPELSTFLAPQLQTPLVEHDSFLRLWFLGVKGDADEETNVDAAEKDWQQADRLADRLGQKQ